MSSELEDILEGANSSNNNQQPKLSNKKKLYLIAAIVICVIAIVVAIIYNQVEANYQKHVSDAKYYVSVGDYQKAYDEIKNLNSKSKDDDLFDKIQMVIFTKMELDLFNDQIKGIGGSPNYEYALGDLLYGLQETIDNEKKASELGVSAEIDSLKSQFLDNLSLYFKLGKDDALKMAQMDSDTRKAEIQKIAIRGATTVESQQELAAVQAMNEVNPIKILDTDSKIDNGYIYVSGAVKNISKTPHSYIQVKVVYMDSSGNVVDTDWTYASSEALQPNEQKYFEIMTKYRDGMDKFRVEIMDFE